MDSVVISVRMKKEVKTKLEREGINVERSIRGISCPKSRADRAKRKR